MVGGELTDKVVKIIRFTPPKGFENPDEPAWMYTKRSCSLDKAAIRTNRFMQKFVKFLQTKPDSFAVDKYIKKNLKVTNKRNTKSFWRSMTYHMYHMYKFLYTFHLNMETESYEDSLELYAEMFKNEPKRMQDE
jgi:hypothetical protein